MNTNAANAADTMAVTMEIGPLPTTHAGISALKLKPHDAVIGSFNEWVHVRVDGHVYRIAHSDIVAAVRAAHINPMNRRKW